MNDFDSIEEFFAKERAKIEMYMSLSEMASRIDDMQVVLRGLATSLSEIVECLDTHYIELEDEED